MIDVFITHYLDGTPGSRHMNALLVDQITWTRATTEKPFRTTVVYYASDISAEAEMLGMLPPDVRAVRNDRVGRTDIQPSLRNKVVDLMRVSDADFCVLLHNDVRVARGWLDVLEADLEYAERDSGAPAIVSPRHVPYHKRADDEALWDEFKLNPNILTPAQMRVFCAQHGFHMQGIEVLCPSWGPPIRNGHQLMMWAARPETVRRLGYCDERYTGTCYDDSDWGMRALLTGLASYSSQSALIGHVAGMSYGIFSGHQPTINERVFKTKWGTSVFDELQSGSIWPRLQTWRRTGALDVADLFQLVTEPLQPDSMIDVGTGRNGVVGLHLWDRLPGRRVAVDIHAIKGLPVGWEPVIADARDLLKRFGPKSFDVVQACDFVEHLPIEADILAVLEALARKIVLVFTPIAPDGGVAPSPSVDTEPDNPYQRHLSGYRYEDFEARGYTTARHIEENMWRDTAIVAWKIF